MFAVSSMTIAMHGPAILAHQAVYRDDQGARQLGGLSRRMKAELFTKLCGRPPQ